MEVSAGLVFIVSKASVVFFRKSISGVHWLLQLPCDSSVCDLRLVADLCCMSYSHLSYPHISHLYFPLSSLKRKENNINSISMHTNYFLKIIYQVVTNPEIRRWSYLHYSVFQNKDLNFRGPANKEV